jgi:glycosyltransferase involved in cell wall biosynthesis
MGLPVVTFDTPVSREYLGDLGIYAQFGSADDLAAKLRLALEQHEWSRRLGRLGREQAVRKLASDQAGPEIEAIYAAALRHYYKRRPDPFDETPESSHEPGEQAVERGA